MSRLARFGTKEGRFRQKRHSSLLQIETFSPVHDLDGKSLYEGVSPALGKERIGRARISARSGHCRTGRGSHARRHDAAEESAISLSPLPRVTTPSGPAYPSNRVSSVTFRVPPLDHRQLRQRLHLAQFLMSDTFESQADRLHDAFLPWRIPTRHRAAHAETVGRSGSASDGSRQALGRHSALGKEGTAFI